jgi:hypothetical protein
MNTFLAAGKENIFAGLPERLLAFRRKLTEHRRRVEDKSAIENQVRHQAPLAYSRF